MRTLFASLCVLGIGLASAQAETVAQKQKYIKDLTGTSCTAANLPLSVRPAAGDSKVSAKWPKGHATIIRDQVDSRGTSWVYVSNDDNKSQKGWVNLDDLNCI